MKFQVPTIISRYPFQFWTTSILFLWIFFFDGSNLLGQFRLWRKQNAIEAEKQFYINKIKEVKKEGREMMGTPQSREQFAREKYLMRKKGETIFVIVDDEGKSIEEEK